MKNKSTGKKSNQVVRPIAAKVSEAPPTALDKGPAGKLAKDDSEAGSLDTLADGVVDRIDKFFTRHESKLKFIRPALLSFVGCLTFAGFDAFGGTHLLDDFTSEHATSLGHPYFLLGGFLLALHLLLATPDGKSFVGKWVVGTFSNLVEHVLLLGLGVFLWLSLVEVFAKPSGMVVFTIVWVTIVLLGLAKLFQAGAKLCKGEYFQYFGKKKGRLAALRIVGFIFVIASGLDCYRFLQKQHREDASHSVQPCVTVPAFSSASPPASKAASH
jgi:hypothetical protein